MNKWHILLAVTLLLALCISAIATGCGPDDQDLRLTKTPTPAITSATPVPMPAQVQPGMIAIYFHCDIGVSTRDLGYYMGYDLGETTTYTGAIFRYLPELNDLRPVYDWDIMTSLDIYPHTVDGRSYLMIRNYDFEYVSIIQYDPLFSTEDTGPTTHTSIDHCSGNYAILGDRVYFTDFERDFNVASLGTKDAFGDTLLGRNQSDNYGELHAVGDRLYRVDQNSDAFGVNLINSSSGYIQQRRVWNIITDTQSNRIGDLYVFEDQNALYLANQYKVMLPDGSSQYYITLNKLSSDDYDQGKDPERVFGIPCKEGDKLVHADADDGYIVLHIKEASGANRFWAHECASDKFNDFYLSGNIDVEHMQVLKVR